MNRYEALRHAIRAHGQDTDWGGQLYVLHPMAVADRIEAHWSSLPWAPHPVASMAPPHGISVESGVIVGLLHDVLEDTDYELRQSEFTSAQWDALDRVTRWPGETYREYIEKAAGSMLSTVVKLADLSHNMSDERKVGLTEEQLEQAAGLQEKRYEPSRNRLWEALGVEWWPA